MPNYSAMRRSSGENLDILKTFGKPHGSALVIVPMHSEYHLIAEHMRLLAKQTSTDFDVILILNHLTDSGKVLATLESCPVPSCVIVAKRKEDTGSAGGFFSGQKYALEQGYENMILADIDCMPIDQSLVGKLIAASGHDMVLPEFEHFHQGDTLLIAHGRGTISQYGLVSSRLAREKGLYYAPLYLGGDDYEYQKRLGRPVQVKAKCRHPYMWTFSLFNPDKCLLYMQNSMISNRNPARFLNGLLSTSAMLALLLTFAPYGPRAFSSMALLMVSGTYGKAAAERLNCGFGSYTGNRRPDLMRLGPPITEKFDIRDAFSIAKSAFRKEVILDNNSFILAVLACIFAKKVYLHTGSGRMLLLADNSHPMFHLARVLLLPLSAALSAMLGAIFIPVKVIRTPRTFRYGL